MNRIAVSLAVLIAWAPVLGSETTVDRARVADLDWLAGCWSAEQDGLITEECWTAPRGGMILGVHRDSRGSRGAFEFLRIADDGDRVVYFASPSGRERTPFALAESGDRSVVFENLEHDFPRRIHYWIDAENRLHAQVEGVVDSEPEALQWVWQRVDW